MAAGVFVAVRAVPSRSGWRVYWREEKGGKRYGSKIHATAEAAEALAAAIRTRIMTRQRSVADAIAEYRADLDKRVARGDMVMESARNAENALRQLHAAALDSPLGSLTERRAGELYETLVEGGGAASTQHRALRTARTFGDWLATRHWLKTNPWANVEQVGERDDARDVVLRGGEAAKFRDAALSLARGGDDSAVAALLTLVCGLSPIEIVQIEARDIDGDTLWIAGARLKTKNRRRQLDVLDADAVALLAELASRVKEGPIFGELSRDEVTAAVRRVGAAAGLKMQLDARTMRRTFSTLGARRGASLDGLAYSLGHGADGKAQTARTYYVQPGAAESGHARRVLGVLDGGRKK